MATERNMLDVIEMMLKAHSDVQIVVLQIKYLFRQVLHISASVEFNYRHIDSLININDYHIIWTEIIKARDVIKSIKISFF